MSSELTSDEIAGLLDRSVRPADDGYVGLSDPDGAEQLATELARRCMSLEPSCLLIWERPHDLVLAHVVARTLGVPTVRAYNRDGLVGYEGTFPDAGRTLLLGDAFRSAETVRAMCVLASQWQQQVVGASALLDVGGPGSDELHAREVPLVVLAERRSQEQENVGE